MSNSQIMYICGELSGLAASAEDAGRLREARVLEDTCTVLNEILSSEADGYGFSAGVTDLAALNWEEGDIIRAKKDAGDFVQKGGVYEVQKVFEGERVRLYIKRGTDSFAAADPGLFEWICRP